MRFLMLLGRGAAPLSCRSRFRHEKWGFAALRQQHFFRSKVSVSPKCLRGRLSTLSGGAKLKKQQEQPRVNVTVEERVNIAWWQERMKLCRKPATVEIMKRLVYNNLLGLDATLRNGSMKENTLNAELLDVKRKFPREVLLCRVGEFYEALGFDACILVEHAGLNPSGGCRGEGVPKAGCPTMNLRQTLNELTNAGFSVCILEEVQAPCQGRQRKERFVAGHAHPGSPYIYGLAAADTDIDFPEPTAIIGISVSTRGYCFISVMEMMRTYSVEHELTEEAVVTKLRSLQYQHLFLHRSLRANTADTVRWAPFGEGGLLWGECKGKLVEWYDHDPVFQLLENVRDLYDIDGSEHFREIVRPSSGRPRPLYMSTASQIGVLVTPGIPSLLKVAVPPDCSGLCLRYLRDLLLNPPPYNVATAIQDAVKLMSAVKCSIPEFICEPAGKLVKLITGKEVNHLEFSRIQVLAEDVLFMYEKDELKEIFSLLLEPTMLATGLRVDAQSLINDCKELVSQIQDFIAEADDPEQVLSASSHIPSEFFYDMESGWKGRVQRKHVEEHYVEVEKRAAELIAAVEEDFVPIVVRTKSLVPTQFRSGSGEIFYLREYQSLWFKGKGFQPVLWGGEQQGEEQIKRLKHALDSRRKKIGDEWHTTEKVDLALESYKESVSKANNAVIQTLKNLAENVKKQINSVVFISVFCVIAKALFAHAREGKRRQWTFPELQFQQDVSQKKMVLTDLVPYWLDTTQELAVPNSFELSSMCLLTGPNGGGKSSLLRSVCAAALLGISGLMVPAKQAVIPMLDGIMLRVTSQDSPSEGKSLFQMEMAELRTILTETSGDTLVLIDELCKGTEVQKGTCLLASTLEKLDRLGCIGIISTHLHDVFDMQLDLKNVVYKAMGTMLTDREELEPTWRLVDGRCRESLAFETARKQGVPEEILERASHHYKMLQSREAHTDEAALKLNGAVCLAENQPQASTELCSENAAFSAAPNTSSGNHSLKDVENAVVNITRATLGETSPCNLVGPRQQPPPFTSNQSCVYVVQRPDRKFYVGQTDNLAGRIAAHRSTLALKQAPFLYMPVSNKSVACQLEAALITQLNGMGFNLVNKVDQNHRHFGISPPPF